MFDYILVGFGLAGSSLAFELEQRGKTFVVFEDGSQQASKVAGGLYNPVVLKKFKLAWDAADQLQTAVSFYKALGKQLGRQFQQSIPIYRKFNSEYEQNQWSSARKNPDLTPFLAKKLMPDYRNIPAEFQFGEVRGTGLVRTKALLDAYAAYLLKKEQFIAKHFAYPSLEIKADFVRYKGIQAKQIIFCEGFGMRQNPFFQFLPLQGNKGEYIIIKAPSLGLKEIIKAGIFIIPLGNHLYKVGATYAHNFENQRPTKSARQKIIQKLEEMLVCDYTVVDQIAGVRPTLPDRKPVVGRHTDHKNLYCCNGFGSRGVLMAPNLSKRLLAFIEEKKPLPAEVDLQRFF